MMGGALGIFDGLTVTASSNTFVNSPIALNGLINGLSTFTYFLVPTIIGASIYRDFKYNMHTILFSYPFTKMDYLLGKFLSSLFIVILIVATIGVATYLASFLPGINQDLLGSYSTVAYLQIYCIFVIPNLFFYGVIVFAIVTISRNISVGFIAVIVLLFIDGVIGGYTRDADNRYLAGILDPSGSEALSYYTQYWTASEKNANLLPFESVMIYNRLLWLGVAVVIFILLYRYFSFTQTALTFGRSKNVERVTKNNFGGITRIKLPNTTFDYSTKNNLKTAWNLSNIDFVFIVKNWVFISIVIVGLLFILLTSLTSGVIFGTSTYPTTWQMLEIPGSTFGLFINLLTFLFAGILTHHGATTRMNHLVDVTPTPNWVFLVSKFLAVVKMQIVLLAVILIAGVAIQTYHGYYNFEIGHYLYELYFIKLINFIIWAFLAFFIQTLFKNYLLGFFVLLVLSIGLAYLPAIGVEQAVFRFNSDSGYQYSDMNGYGSSLPLYFLYKGYWFMLGLALFGLTLLFWTRGMGQKASARLKDAKDRFNGKKALLIRLSLIGFLALAATFYYQNNILHEYESNLDNEKAQANWEKKYKKYQNFIQPRITAINVDIALYPEKRDFVASGTYILKNKSKQAIDSILINYNDFKTEVKFAVASKLVSKDSVFNFDIYKLDKPLVVGDSIVMNFEIKNEPNSIFRSNSPVIGNGT